MDESGTKDEPNGNHQTARRIVLGLVLLLLLAVIASLAARVIANLRDGITAAEWTTIGIVAAFIAMVVVAGFLPDLKKRYAWVGRVSHSGANVGAGAVTAYVVVLLMGGYVVVLLAAFSIGFNQWVVDGAPVVQALIVAVLGVIAAVSFHVLLSRDRRCRFIKKLLNRRFGVLFAAAFLTVAASVALTASSALLLVGADHSWWEFRTPRGGDPTSQVVDSDRLAADALTSKLVLWELLDLVPIVELPQTLAWEEPPLTYEDWGVGLVLLAFKGVAGVALLATGKTLFDAWAKRNDPRAPRATNAVVGTG